MQKDLQAIRGKFYIHRLIDEGEHEHQDFKFKISDARKIARSISAFANNDGGRLLVGVRDNGTIAGLRSEEDMHLIDAAARIYCTPAQEVEMQAFLCEGSAVVLRVNIPRADRRPVEVKEEDGTLRAYFRVADENISAHPLMETLWRMEAEGRSPGVLAYCAQEQALLEALTRLGPLSVERLMLEAHLSQATAEDTILRLASAGLIRFEYHHPAFLLTIV